MPWPDLNSTAIQHQNLDMLYMYIDWWLQIASLDPNGDKKLIWYFKDGLA